MTSLRLLPVPAGPPVLEVLPALGAALSGDVQPLPADCKALDLPLQQLGEACQGCHRDYR